jgi:sugar phosphate permease
MAKFGIERGDASFITMLMYVGLCVGSLLLPWINDRLNILNSIIRFCSVGIGVTFCLILFMPLSTPWILGCLLMALGMFCGAEMLCFSGVVLYAPPGKLATTLGIVNTLNMLGGAVAQQAIGFMIDHICWDGLTNASGERIYTTQNYTYSLSILLVIIFSCCIAAYMLPHKKSTIPVQP